MLVALARDRRGIPLTVPGMVAGGPVAGTAVLALAAGAVAAAMALLQLTSRTHASAGVGAPAAPRP